MRMHQQQRQLLLETLIDCIMFMLLISISGVSSNVIKQDEAESLTDNQNLYNASDFVIVLNATNFKSIYNSKRTWLVEFYNSWCGYCQRFAPIWKSLAKNIYGWRHVVAVAAIDCANDDNNPICRDYEIMEYPTIKFFPINTDVYNLGLDLKRKDEMDIIQSLIKQLEKEQQEQRGGSSWPNITPYRAAEVETLWHGAPNNLQYQFLIFEEPKSYLGAQIILDLHKLDAIRIRRVTSENKILYETSKVTKFPSVIAVGRDNSQTFLKIDTFTRDGVKEAIINFLKSRNIPTYITEDKIDVTYASESKLIIKSNDERESNNLEDKLYQLDLENTLRYSLNNEIPLSPTISDEKMDALKGYLKLLDKYFPIFLPKGRTYLRVLKEIIETKINISGKEFKEHVKIKEKGLAPVYSGPKAWIGCKGSSLSYRGYPCGLWTMFHTLTVAAAEELDNELNNSDNHRSVLAIMHSYIKNFFTCADCADHFQDMAKRRKLFEVRDGDESILWLWRAHNEVNERLAGDITEDPEHKKIQYPAAKNCPKCKLPDGKWDEIEVLRYLKVKYSRLNIDFQGINQKVMQHEIRSSASNSDVSSHKIGWDFTIFDISICVVLYALSATILTLVCIKFAFKRTYKKKISFQHLFGLV